ncbi:folylpolyglutamate synthase/dihydrofolate synthase family protein [Gulosibacter sp. 10]|uniref:bifunctional folylpolyglutamate synthase/dihydrofolate synthase n=1 Tax=Gulosibacter sp. 10 TaxID=1255570 RepID=UPI00097EEC5D|nr:cyanophycin synthetase [Gulosibacter sp. 10]SJM61921.1 Dihydrofolate synthase / Folylpolyglutamate synthase [Gulosibacter sp. 10]
MNEKREDEEFDPDEELTNEYLMKLFGGSPFDELAAEDAESDPEEISEREREQREELERTDWRAEADLVYDELMERVGEAQPEPRLAPTRRACELLGDIHRAWPMIHITGTNGKSSTARIAESLLRAHGLRTGLLTSPHLIRLNERITIEGEPIADERLVANWRDIEPFLRIVDGELDEAGEPRLTFFEALTVLAFACFTDAPVDVAVVEVGMGGEWDSTNVADGAVSVLTPISLDHQDRLGSTVGEIAGTKSGIIKPSAQVVTAAQSPEALEAIRRACMLQEATLHAEPEKFAVTADRLAVGGRLVSVRGIAGQYDDLPVALAGEYQAHNAALAIAAVEAFFGGERELDYDTVVQGTASAVSPGRLELIGAEPTVLIDAAHNPHGAAHLAQAVGETYAFDELIVVLGALHGKNVEGMIKPIANVASRIIVTQSDSPRSIDAFELGERVADAIGSETAEEKRLAVIDRAQDAFETARETAQRLSAQAEGEDRPYSVGVLITGSVTLIGEAAALALEDGWKPTPEEREAAEEGVDFDALEEDFGEDEA